MVGLSTSAIYRKMRAKTFPVALHLGGAVRWRSDEVEAWIESREVVEREAPRGPVLGAATPADLLAAKVEA